MSHWQTRRPVWVIVTDCGLMGRHPTNHALLFERGREVSTFATRALARPMLAFARRMYPEARLARVRVKFEEL